MLTAETIHRLFQHSDHEKLLRAVADNGFLMPLPLRLRLSQGPIGAIALGLRRLVELTYGPTPATRDMLETLLARQREDGAFVGGGDGPDPLATAVAAAALTRVVHDHPAAATDTVIEARDRAMMALATLQDVDGLFTCPEDRDDTQRGLVAAFILSMLAGDETFRATVRLAELMSWFEERAHALDEDTTVLYRLARAADPMRTPQRRGAPLVPAAA